MHEYPLTVRIIEIASQKAREAGAAGVSCIRLAVGDSSGVVADSIVLYFDIVAQDTPCQGSVLEVEHIKSLLRCKRCGEHFERRPFEFNCPVKDCGGEGEPTEIGREFFIKDIEVFYPSDIE